MPKYRNDLTAERLRELLSYDPATGVFRWKVKKAQRINVGDIAGSLNSKGYLLIRIDNRNYRAHRLAWLHVHGEWPKNQLDHRNGVRPGNWIENLREATQAENNQNLALRRDNKSGHPGVGWSVRSHKWEAHIRVSGRKHHIGYFDHISDAVNARADAKADLHKFQPTHRFAEPAIAAAQPFTEK